MAETSVVVLFERPMLEVCGLKSTIGDSAGVDEQDSRVSEHDPPCICWNPAAPCLRARSSSRRPYFPVSSHSDIRNETPMKTETRKTCQSPTSSGSARARLGVELPDDRTRLVMEDGRLERPDLGNRNAGNRRRTSGAARGTCCRSVSRSGSVQLRLPSTPGLPKQRKHIRTARTSFA